MQFPSRWMWAVIVAAAALGGGASAQVEPAIVTIVGGETNPGGVPDFSVRLRADGPAPVAMTLFIAYDNAAIQPDPDYYEFVTEIGDTVVSTRSAVRPSARLLAAGKTTEVEIFAEGVIGIVIAGLNNTPIPDGELFSVGCRVADDLLSGAQLNLVGIDSEDSPVSVTNLNTGETGQVRSSAAYPDGDVTAALPVFFFDGAVNLECGGRFTAPAGLTASTGDPDEVTLTWSTVIGAGATYRVFRSDTQNLGDAVPLGSDWTELPRFTDRTAAGTIEVTTQGCMPMVLDRETVQYYWVVARDDAGCETAYAGPVSGFRGGATTATQSAGPSGRGAGDLLLFAATLLLLAPYLHRHRFSR